MFLQQLVPYCTRYLLDLIFRIKHILDGKCHIVFNKKKENRYINRGYNAALYDAVLFYKVCDIPTTSPSCQAMIIQVGKGDFVPVFGGFGRE